MVRNVRNLRDASLDLSPSANLVHGANGSGKTSLLEAIHLLLVGRSFRHHRVKPLVSDGAAESLVVGQLVDSAGRTLRIGTQRGINEKPLIKVNGRRLQSLSELVALLPVQVMDGHTAEIASGPPARRRQLLDWALFHVEHEFYSAWRQADRALRQRNELVRRGRIDSLIDTWSAEYARRSQVVDEARTALFSRFAPPFSAILAGVNPGLEGQVSLAYSRGWPEGQSLEALLLGSADRDVKQGYTRYGPHRADMRVTAGGKPAAEVLSRGQLKLVAGAMQLALVGLIRDTVGKACLLLVDDLPAELDRVHRRVFASALCNSGSQLFITCVDRDEMGQQWHAGLAHPPQVFHVEHGEIEACA